MDTIDFNPNRLEPYVRHAFHLDIACGAGAEPLRIPVVCTRGGDGPTLAVLAGVHGDEYEGVAALHRVLARLIPDSLSGTLLAVPVANLAAASVCSRVSPIDGIDLARTFPGSAEGTSTERLAHCLTEQVIARADLLVDLHSAGVHNSMPTLTGFYARRGCVVSERSRQAALAFGSPVVWQHDEIGPGRTLTVASEMGIPAIYAETTGGAWIRDDDLDCYVRGVFNLMRHLGMLGGEPKVPSRRVYLRGGGDLDSSVSCANAGFLRSYIGLLESASRGSLLGSVSDPFGDPIENVYSPRDGIVVFRRETPAVRAGDHLYALALESVPSEQDL